MFVDSFGPLVSSSQETTATSTFDQLIQTKKKNSEELICSEGLEDSDDK